MLRFGVDGTRVQPVTASGSWASRPGLSLLLRAVARVAPLAAGMLAAFGLAQRWPRPHAGASMLAWWVVVLAASAVVMVSVERLSRRLLPLSALFSLSLAFPDQAPSRFRSALRSGNSKTLLAQRAEYESGVDDLVGQQTAYVASLLTEISTHDRLTRGHVERVRAFSQMIGEELGLSPEDMDRLQWAALLHDAGKVDVPSEILSKPGKLTDEEYAIVKAHPADGGRSKDGRYRVMAPPEKLYVDGEMIYCAKADRERVYTIVYTDPEYGFTYMKRFKTGGFIMGKEYRCAPEGSKVLLFDDSNPQEIYLKYKPSKGQRIHQQVFHPTDVLVKGAKARGNQMTAKKIAKIATIKPRWWKDDDTSQRGRML